MRGTAIVMCIFHVRNLRLGKLSNVAKLTHLVNQFSSVALSSPTLHPRGPTDCSVPGFPIHHQLAKLAQTHVH